MEKDDIARREFIRTVAVGAASGILGQSLTGCAATQRRGDNKIRHMPNLVFVFADQMRAQATGYAGDPNAITPNLDRFAKESVNFVNAVSGCPVCSPYRASLITGQYPLTHGVFLNDVCLNKKAVSIAEVYKRAGYKTAYIGKWHLDGHGRSSFIPRERRQGFDFWRVLECTHKYNESYYYADNSVKLKWDGYDVIAQTREAQKYIERQTTDKPFVLFLSWGPPHNPYDTAPEKYKSRFANKELVLRRNVPVELQAKAAKKLRGYYAHIAAIDDCFGDIVETIRKCGIEENTILVFTSDHGDLLYSHGQLDKQQPFEESIRVPLLLRYPAVPGNEGRKIDMPINTPDIMPTLLGLSGMRIPGTVEGKDFSGVLRAAEKAGDDAVLITCLVPFGQWKRKRGGREYRGVRTKRYTYVRDLNGPWLLYDNLKDPYQLNNLCNKPEYKDLQNKLEDNLSQKLRDTKDKFLPAANYIRKWGHNVDEEETVPYTE